MDTGNELHAHDRAAYRITVQGVLDEGGRIGWKACASNQRAAARTVLEGVLADQSALVGVLGVLQGLGLPVISVEYLGQDNRTVRQGEEP